MVADIFLSMCQSPTFRKYAWKPIYNSLAKIYNVDYWHFMNYGYAFNCKSEAITLESKDEPYRYASQLYHRVASAIDLTGKDVLEVGCGRGGGASYIKRYLQPRSMVGLDLAEKAIEFAKRTHIVEDLSYVQGNAQDLPFEENSFDVLVNVESCHAYPSMSQFFKEVKRVLKPGGYFLCADIRLAKDMIMMENKLKHSGMKLVEVENINPNVIKAIELNDHELNRLIEIEIHSLVRPLFKEFAGVKDSKIHRDLISNTRVYNRFALQN